MTEYDEKELICIRGILKGRLTSMEKYLIKYDPAVNVIAEITSRLEALPHISEDLNDTQLQIEVLMTQIYIKNSGKVLRINSMK